MVSPLQLLLIYPLFKAGAALTSSQIMSGTLDSFTERFRLDVWNTLLELGTTAMFAVAVWAVISVPVGIILYKVSLPVFRRISDKNETERTNL
jgi:ABC-type proline/glycine betaine transport system permease subunit